MSGVAPARRDRVRHAFAVGALATLAVATYASTVRNGFVLDARALVLENPRIRAATAANVGYLLGHDYWQPLATGGLYRPLTTLSFLVDWAVLGHGARPAGYHVLDVALHATCVALVYALVWTLVGRRWPAVVAAGLFAVHPVTTEVVANVAGRADLLAAAGVLAGLVCSHRAGVTTGHARRLWLGGLLGAAALAAFAKETGLVLFPAMVAADALRPRRRDAAAYALVAAVLVVYAGARWHAEHASPPGDDVPALDNPVVEAPLWRARLTAVDVLGRELGLLVWPRTLSADYSCCEIPVVGAPPTARETVAIAGAVAVVGALAGVAIAVRRRDPAIAFLIAFLGIALVPTSNLLVTIGSVMAERFLYLPLAAAVGAAALALDAVRRRVPAALVDGAVVVAILACAVRSDARVRDWHDELALWSSTVVAAPRSAKAHKAYGAALHEAQGDAALPDAIAEAETALAIRPDYQQAMVDLGAYEVRRGDLLATRDAAAARAAYERAIAVLEPARPLDRDAERRFAERLVARGARPEAIPSFGDAQLWDNLSVAYARAGRDEDALGAYERLRRLDPTNPRRHVDVSAALCRLARWDDAAVALHEGLLVGPADRDAAARLVEVYRRAGVSAARLDPGEPIVRRDRCRALAALAELYATTGFPELAAEARVRHDRDCGVPTGTDSSRLGQP